MIFRSRFIYTFQIAYIEATYMKFLGHFMQTFSFYFRVILQGSLDAQDLHFLYNSKKAIYFNTLRTIELTMVTVYCIKVRFEKLIVRTGHCI